MTPENNPTTALIHYDAACRALAAARNVDEAKEIRDKAEALRVYGQQAKNKQLEIDASEIRIRAERRLGELLQEQKSTIGFNPGAKGIGTSAVPNGNHTIPTLADAGIDKKLSSRAQKLAQIPLEEFEERLAERREQEITSIGDSIFDKPHVSYNSGENEWYTPQKYIDAAREVMGDIDLDPCSTEIANDVVRATRYYTKEDNALHRVWLGRIWMNPPYSSDLISPLCHKFIHEIVLGDIEEAIVLVNNATDTGWFQSLAAGCSAVCFPMGRVKFWAPNRDIASPLQGQALLYYGNQSAKFKDVFKSFGIVLLHR